MVNFEYKSLIKKKYRAKYRRVKANLTKVFNISTIYLASCFWPLKKDQIRVVIFGQGRTGSTLLENLICSTGYFNPNYELLNVVFGEKRFPYRYIRGLSNIRRRENFIFHVKIYQLTRDRSRKIDPYEFLRSLRKDGWKVIYLKRKNKVRHAISNVIIEKRGQTYKFDNEKLELKLKIDCSKFETDVKERIKFDLQEEKIMENIGHIKITYEEDLEDSNLHQITVNKTLKYLSLDQRKAATKLFRINNTKMSDMIINYSEFKKMIDKNGWNQFVN